MDRIWYWIAISAMVIGFTGSLIPAWRSANLSPESIKRRFYWTGGLLVIPCLVLSDWPYWQGGLFAAAAFFLCLVAIAFFRTGHIKIRGRIYSASSDHRRPDRPRP